MGEREPGVIDPEQFNGWKIKHEPPKHGEILPIYKNIMELYHPVEIKQHGPLIEYLIDTSDPSMELSQGSRDTLAHYTAETALNGLRFYVYVVLKGSDPFPSVETLERIIKSRQYVVVVAHGLMGGANVVIGNDDRSRNPIIGKGLTFQEIEGLKNMDWSKNTVNTAAVLAQVIPDSVIIVPDVNNGAGAVGDAPWFKPECDYPLRSVKAIGYQLLAHLNMLGLLSGLPSDYRDINSSSMVIKPHRRILFSGHSMGGAGPMEGIVIYNYLLKLIHTNMQLLGENDFNTNEMAEVLMLAYNAAYIRGWQRELFNLFGETRRLGRLVNPFVWPLTFFMLDQMPPKLRGIYARNYQDPRYWDTFRAACYSLASPKYSLPPKEIDNVCGMLVTANPEVKLKHWERLARILGAPRDLLVSEANLKFILETMGWPGLIRTTPVGHTGPWAGYDGLLEYVAAIRASLTLPPKDFNKGQVVNDGLDTLVKFYHKLGLQPTTSQAFIRACRHNDWEKVDPSSSDEGYDRLPVKTNTGEGARVTLLKRIADESPLNIPADSVKKLLQSADIIDAEEVKRLLNLTIEQIYEQLSVAPSTKEP